MSMRRALVLIAGILALGLASPVAAGAQGPSVWWRIGAEVSPTNLAPGEEGVIRVTVADLGGGEADGEASPVSVTDTLPPGLSAVAVSGGSRRATTPPRPAMSCTPPPASVITCTYTGRLDPYEQLGVAIKVKVAEPTGTSATLPNEISVEGGGAPSPSSAVEQLTISGAKTPFGIQDYELNPLGEEGQPATQAGVHPFELTTNMVLNQVGTSIPAPVALAKDLRFTLPPGLIGNPTAVAQCSMLDFAAIVEETDLCPPDTVVGVATVTAYEPLSGLLTKTVPVFNLEPAYGEPARLGLEVFGLVEVVIDTSLLSDEAYAVQASVSNVTEAAAVLSSQVTLWGDPGAQSHDGSRGWECVAGGEYRKQVEGEPACPAASAEPETAFLTLPTSCPAEGALDSSAAVSSWAEPSNPVDAGYTWSGPLQELLKLNGCEALPFTPTLQALPETHQASSPTGLELNVRMPQSGLLGAAGPAEADLKDTTITLPEGVQLNPSAANGRQACTEAQIGYQGSDPQDGMQQFTSSAPSCPEASKVGVAHIKTPLLSGELEGALYLAQPAPNGETGQNPFNSLVALYLVAEDKPAGVLVKLAGKGELNLNTGQLSTSFQNTPQLPFEELKVEIFGGQRAPLSTPAHCGEYPVSSSFTAWSGASTQPLAEPPLMVESGPGGASCPPAGALPFSPSFAAQSQNPQAAGFTNFTLEITRPAGQQALDALSVQLPPGVSALLSALTPCAEPPPGQEWSCGQESLIGYATAVSGVGSEPIALHGEAYLTAGYDGAPFGVLVRTLAQAGPFDLGWVDVRSKIDVDPHTARVTISTSPGPRDETLPTMLDGIPVDLDRINVTVDREHFEINPTDCEAKHIEGTLSGAEGATSPISTLFQVQGCENLPFGPVLTASTQGHASKADGANFIVKLVSQGLGQANIAKVSVQLPKQLPSRLTTIQKACPAAVFEANPATCPEGSLIGQATVRTPVLKSAVTGPAYLVSHGGAAFPDIEFVLQGEGITLVLDGRTDIKGGITYSKFESVPDQPFTSFETVLPAGPHSALTANVAESKKYDLCGENLQMPTTIVAQNGKIIERSTKITIAGCDAVKGLKAKKLTRRQLLAKALKTCHKRHRHSKRKVRRECERKARAKYGPRNKKGVHKKGSRRS